MISEAMERKPGLGFESYDRMFPNQDTLPAGGFGNLIALPLQGQSRKDGNTVFVDTDLVPFVSAELRRLAWPAGARQVCVTVVDSDGRIVDADLYDCEPLPGV